ncbi:hypothetical protein lbkm_3998 [Lachnospiraceae bacterium KM106-2]|nr:hypothetical protein lbkm_3998 [Lachnospiraceae bacterium KM106-2]
MTVGMLEEYCELVYLFLPYNASMWESLESIWKAARDDPNYDVYVIQIPLFVLP